MNDLPDPIQRKLSEYLIPHEVAQLSRTNREMQRSFDRYVFHSFKTLFDEILSYVFEDSDVFEKLQDFFPSLSLANGDVEHLFYLGILEEGVIGFCANKDEVAKVFVKGFCKAFPSIYFQCYGYLIEGWAKNETDVGILINQKGKQSNISYDGKSLTIKNVWV